MIEVGGLVVYENNNIFAHFHPQNDSVVIEFNKRLLENDHLFLNFHLLSNSSRIHYLIAHPQDFYPLTDEFTSQMMLPEAIAIVMAPTDSSRQVPIRRCSSISIILIL